MTGRGKETGAFFEHFSSGDKPTKSGKWIVESLARRVFEYIGLEKGQCVLEIGPGRGDFAGICLKTGIDYTAIEANENMAIELEKRSATVKHGMVPPLPVMDSKFDATVMINVMEHMNTMQDALQVTKEVNQVLKSGGRFLVCSPDYLNWRKNFFNCDFSHNYVTTRRRLEQLLINGGFQNIRSIYMSGPLTGLACYMLSSIVGRMPFAFLNSIFPKSRICYKLYKIQLTFSRKVLIVGEKPR